MLPLQTGGPQHGSCSLHSSTRSIRDSVVQHHLSDRVESKACLRQCDNQEREAHGLAVPSREAIIQQPRGTHPFHVVDPKSHWHFFSSLIVPMIACKPAREGHDHFRFHCIRTRRKKCRRLKTCLRRSFSFCSPGLGWKA